ncbi:MAG: SufD family Fe-S cluster assembly protein [Gammaproteobacteria bacterium]|nr:SufD family Fe-S cluster assembly protein [Gammaproteobacteria bacterium]
MATRQSPLSLRDELLGRVLAQKHVGSIDGSVAKQVLQRQGLPIPHKGRWQFTDLSVIIDDAIALRRNANLHESSVADLNIKTSSNVETSLSGQMGAVEASETGSLIAVNGIFAPRFVQLKALDSADQVANIELPNRRQLDHYRIKIGKHAACSLTDKFTGGNRVVLCELDGGATLDYSMVLEPTKDISYHALVVTMHADSTFNLHSASRGAKLSCNEVVVNIVGASATASLSGGWHLNDHSHSDTHVYVNHRVGGSTSEQKFHGVVDDSARSSFTGCITIEQDASGTEAHLTNRNLATGPNARAYAQPELEIYTDDVVCSHGATTGQLDDDALFLLQSRGIAESRARELLIRGFLRAAVDTPEGAKLLSLET